jgi:hypothetical protein
VLRPAWILCLLVLALALAACGGDDESGDRDAAATTTQPATAETEAETQTAPAETAEEETDTEAEGGGSPEDEEAVRETILTWLLEGDCDLMTDEFLEEQAFVGDTREERCKFFEDSFQKPQYGRDAVKFRELKVTGDEATAVIGDEISNVEARYDLVRKGEGWQIASSELE